MFSLKLPQKKGECEPTALPSVFHWKNIGIQSGALGAMCQEWDYAIAQPVPETGPLLIRYSGGPMYTTPAYSKPGGRVGGIGTILSVLLLLFVVGQLKAQESEDQSTDDTIDMIVVTGSIIFQNGGDVLRLSEFSSLYTNIERTNVNAFGRYEVVDGLRLKFEAWYAKSDALDVVNQSGYNSPAFGGLPGNGYGNVGEGPIPAIPGSSVKPTYLRHGLQTAQLTVLSSLLTLLSQMPRKGGPCPVTQVLKVRLRSHLPSASLSGPGFWKGSQRLSIGSK